MQDWFLRNSETNRSCLKGWCMPVVLKSAHQFTRQISKQSSNNQVEVFHPLTKQLRVFHVSSEPQMCPHWLVSLYVYRSGNDTHCSAKGPCSRHTCTHTHTHSHWDCMHDCMHLQSNTDKQACTCTKTHIHSLALTYTNTYTGLSLTLALFHSCKHTHTNSRTLTRWARRPDGVTAWAVGLSHSGDLISHCFFSFTDPYSSLPSSHLPSFFFTLSSMSTHFTLFFLSRSPFILFSDFSPLHFNKQ